MRSRLLLAALAIGLAISSGSVSAALFPANFTGTPQDSWAYYELAGAGHGQSITYFPTTLAEFQSAIFQGYVTYNAGDPPSYWFGQGFDSIQVFETYLQSSTELVLPLIVGGDDGHSLFVNGVFIGGGPYGDAGVLHTLSLQANSPVLVQLVGYNGPGPFAFSIRLQGSDTLLDDVPGLQMNATGAFSSAVPEPSTIAVWAVVCGLSSISFGLRRKKTARHV